MSDQTYNVKYNIEVESTEATRQLGNFTAAVEALSKFKGDMSGAVENVQNALKAIDKALRTDPSGKGRKYNYKFNIDTKYGEAKLGRIVTALTTIENKKQGHKPCGEPRQGIQQQGRTEKRCGDHPSFAGGIPQPIEHDIHHTDVAHAFAGQDQLGAVASGAQPRAEHTDRRCQGAPRGDPRAARTGAHGSRCSHAAG